MRHDDYEPFESTEVGAVPTYVGTCQPIFGSPTNHGGRDCGPDVRWQVDVDGATGTVPAAFGYDYTATPDEQALELQTSTPSPL